MTLDLIIIKPLMEALLLVNQVTTITLGASGDTITLASGASQTGFGRSGSVRLGNNSPKTARFHCS